MEVEKEGMEVVITVCYSNLRELQMAVIVSYVMGHDVFGILPTGYGKSLCYQCLPLIFDKVKLGSASSSVVVVLALLTAVMKDQVL